MVIKDKLAIKENFDDDDLSDDVDDEVFVRDGKKSILKMEKHKCDERPLMPMRRKSKVKAAGSSPEVRSRQPCNIYNCLLPVYFAIAAVISIGFFLMLYIFLVDKLPLLVGKLHLWTPSMNSFNTAPILAPCSNFKLDLIWSTNVASAISDSQVEMVDIDRDNVSDIVIGVAAKWKDLENADVGCSQAVHGRSNLPVCNGGVVAINGKTGSTLWRQQVSNAVLDVQCRLEISGDGVTDCLLIGKEGLLAMLSGADGKILWQRIPEESSYDLYNILIIRDVNNDGYLDILATRYRPNSGTKRKSEIEVISGADGQTISRVAVFQTILHPPRLLIGADGYEFVCFFTGSPEEKGAIFSISLHDLLFKDEKKIKALYHFDSSILAAPLLVDVNVDGIHDLVFVAGANVYVLEGDYFTVLWNVSILGHVDPTYRIFSTSSPTAAYFNDDWIPDLLITFVVGTAYPNWYYSLIVIFDGKTGNLLNDPLIRSGIVDTPGGISMSFEGHGNDAFIYWTSSCRNYTRFKKPFALDHSVHDLRFVDLCHLRFNASTRLELFAFSQHVKPPGVLLLAHESRHDDSPKNAEDVDLESPPVWLLENILNSGKGIYEKGGDPSTNENEWESGQKLRNTRTLNSNSASSNLKSSTYNIEEDDRENSMGRSPYLQSDEIIPRTSSSAILSPSLDGSGLDLVVSHYQVLANPNSCITVDQRQRCSHKITSGRGRDSYNLIGNVDLKQAIYSTVSVARYRLGCRCQLLRKENMEVCSRVLPYELQSYPSFKGPYGSAVYLKRREKFS